MSTRQVRRLAEKYEPNPGDHNSDSEYEPLYVRRSPKSTYAGLAVSSSSDDEHSAQETREISKKEQEASARSEKDENETLLDPDDTSGQDKTENRGAKPKKPSLNNKKKKKKGTRNVLAKYTDDIDEIDKSLKEVNALLGAPPDAPLPPLKPPQDPFDIIFQLQPRYLNTAYELKKLFGADDEELLSRRRAQRHGTQCRRTFIVPMNPEKQLKQGLIMTSLGRQGEYTHFVYNHSPDYQRKHWAYLSVSSFNNNSVLLPLKDAMLLQVEAKIQAIDSMMRVEEFNAASILIESAISNLQYAADPHFNYTGKIRLEYKFLENRPFHILILKYIYLVSNKACHRTALELAKLLLRLDPTDPLAVLTVIDTLALRAREHRWLIEAIDYWARERDASFLYHIAYSNAMAHFHVAHSNKGEVGKADSILKDAIMRFPTVAMRIIENSNKTLADTLAKEELFATAETTTKSELAELILFYATMTISRWREPRVMTWLTRNVEELVKDYNTIKDVKALVTAYANQRQSLFRQTPEQIIRHINVIKPMANLLVEGVIPSVKKDELACDPCPPADTINRYNYERSPNRPLTSQGFFEALFPEIVQQRELERL